jgi:hypothetical protein
MICGGALELSKFFCATRTPNVVVVSAQETNWMAALGAAALDHSASSAASSSSPFAPGSEQLEAPLGGAGLIVSNDPEV